MAVCKLRPRTRLVLTPCTLPLSPLMASFHEQIALVKPHASFFGISFMPVLRFQPRTGYVKAMVLTKHFKASAMAEKSSKLMMCCCSDKCLTNDV